MFTTDKNETELARAFGKLTIEDIQSAVIINLSSFSADASNIKRSVKGLGDSFSKGQITYSKFSRELLSIQFQITAMDAGIAALRDLGAWLMLMPGDLRKRSLQGWMERVETKASEARQGLSELLTYLDT